MLNKSYRHILSSGSALYRLSAMRALSSMNKNSVPLSSQKLQTTSATEHSPSSTVTAAQAAAAPMFSQSELDQIFSAEMLRSIFDQNQEFLKQSEKEQQASYRNTIVKDERKFKKKQQATKEELVFEQKLKDKIDSESHKYDFKVIQRRLQHDTQDNVYLTEE